MKLADELYPDIPFWIADARSLPFADGEFNIVVSGCVILHSAEYETMISEAIRVASKFAVFNRTPVLTDSPTEFYEKSAYGVRTLEVHFNHIELLELFEANGVKWMSFEDVPQKPDSAVRYRCYLLKK
jgi:ubiquinone/menaquinone biosynthesis C-methylase UbiE